MSLSAVLRKKTASFVNSWMLFIYPANNFLNANDCWHFNIYEWIKFMLTLVEH